MKNKSQNNTWSLSNPLLLCWNYASIIKLCNLQITYAKIKAVSKYGSFKQIKTWKLKKQKRTLVGEEKNQRMIAQRRTRRGIRWTAFWADLIWESSFFATWERGSYAGSRCCCSVSMFVCLFLYFLVMCELCDYISFLDISCFSLDFFYVPPTLSVVLMQAWDFFFGYNIIKRFYSQK